MLEGKIIKNRVGADAPPERGPSGYLSTKPAEGTWKYPPLAYTRGGKFSEGFCKIID